MEETFEDLNYIKIAFYVLACGLVVYLGNKFYPEVRWFFPPAVVLIAGFLFLSSIGRYILWKARYKSYQVVVNGCHGSIYGKPDYVPDSSVKKGFCWAVFNLGHSTFPVSLRGKLATLVIPADQIYSAGKSFMGLTLVQKFPLGGLPPKVNFFLRKNKEDFNLDVIYFGKYSQKFIDNSGDETDLSSQITAKDTLINVLNKTIEHDFGNFEEIKEFADRMTRDKTFVRKMIDKVKGVNDEERD